MKKQTEHQATDGAKKPDENLPWQTGDKVRWQSQQLDGKPVTLIGSIAEFSGNDTAVCIGRHTVTNDWWRDDVPLDKLERIQ